jgi:hypothetical protein
VSTTAAGLAAELGMDEGDVVVLLDQLGEPIRALPDELAGFLREMLDPHGERSTPSLDVQRPRRRRRAYGLGGPDPTAAPDDDTDT